MLLWGFRGVRRSEGEREGEEVFQHDSQALLIRLMWSLVKDGANVTRSQAINLSPIALSLRAIIACLLGQLAVTADSGKKACVQSNYWAAV